MILNRIVNKATIFKANSRVTICLDKITLAIELRPKPIAHGFILRIEDTDLARSTEENTNIILRAMNWLGLDYDEGPEVDGPYGPYFQLQRLDLYKAAIDELWEKDAAYPCFCTKEEIDAKREKAIKEENAEQISKLAHSLKGASGNLRVNLVFEYCIDIEKMAKLNDFGEIEISVGKVATTLLAKDLPKTRPFPLSTIERLTPLPMPAGGSSIDISRLPTPITFQRSTEPSSPSSTRRTLHEEPSVFFVKAPRASTPASKSEGGAGTRFEPNSMSARSLNTGAAHTLRDTLSLPLYNQKAPKAGSVSTAS